MEEVQEVRPQETPGLAQTKPVSFRKSKKSGNKKLIAVLLIAAGLIIIVGGGLFLLGKGEPGESEASPTPENNLKTIEPRTPSPSPTSKPVDKSEIKIEILNGTGIAKEASFLQGKLRDIGLTEIETGNASKQNYTKTTISYTSEVPDSIIEEIVEELEDNYQSVSTSKNSSLTSVDIQIITGLRKGATAKPSATATPESTASPTGSPTATPTSSPTAPPTPTP